MPEKEGYAHNEKPELSVPRIKDESFDDDGAPQSQKSSGSAFASALKEAKSECDSEHSKLDGVATRDSGGMGPKPSKPYGAGVD